MRHMQSLEREKGWPWFWPHKIYTPLKFNITPGKMMVGTLLSYWGPVTFEGRTVKLREGKWRAHEQLVGGLSHQPVYDVSPSLVHFIVPRSLKNYWYSSWFRSFWVDDFLHGFKQFLVGRWIRSVNGFASCWSKNMFLLMSSKNWMVPFQRTLKWVTIKPLDIKV